MLCSFIRRILPADMRKQIKRYVRKSKSKLQFWIKPLDMRRILTDDLDIKPGDKLFVTSGFGGLNATFSPKEQAQLLMDIVSSKGMIVMPYYHRDHHSIGQIRVPYSI